MDRGQRVHEKIEVICLLIMFSPGIIVKMAKMAHSFVYSADESKKSVTVLAKYLSTSKRSYLAPSENAMGYWILNYHYQDVNT